MLGLGLWFLKHCGIRVEVFEAWWDWGCGFKTMLGLGLWFVMQLMVELECRCHLQQPLGLDGWKSLSKNRFWPWLEKHFKTGLLRKKTQHFFRNQGQSILGSMAGLGLRFLNMFNMLGLGLRFLKHGEIKVVVFETWCD